MHAKVPSSEEITREIGMPELVAQMETSQGTIHLKLFADQAPLTVANFINLCQRGYYDGLSFHRVIADFMIQGGCPLGTGSGGPGYNFRDEFCADLRHSAPGRLSMANAGPGTNGSQFFITHVATPHLNDAHTIFGEVQDTADQDVVNRIAQGDKIVSVTIEGESATLLEAHADQITQWNDALGD